jgi:hypothetical protein
MKVIGFNQSGYVRRELLIFPDTERGQRRGFA